MHQSQLSMSSYGSQHDDVFELELAENKLGGQVDKQATYKNLYWTGVVSIQSWQEGVVERRLIEPDVKEEVALYEDLEFDVAEGFQFHFNPIDFNNQHKPLLFKHFELSMEQLREYAVVLTSIRRNILEKAASYPATTVEQLIVPAGTRSKTGQVYSTKSRDVAGKSMKEYSELDKAGKYCVGKMKKRNRKQLEYCELVGIVHEYKQNKRALKDIASQYHITPSLAGKLVKESRLDRPLFKERKQQEDQEIQNLECVELSVQNLLLNGCPIWNSKQVQVILERDHQLQLKPAQICKIMRKELGLGYRKVSNIPVQANSERCLVLRQQYAN